MQQLSPTNVSCTQLSCFCSTNAISKCYALQIMPTKTASLGSTSSIVIDDMFNNILEATPPDMSHFLQKYKVIFSISPGLPLARLCNHHILLQPNSSPVKVKPYQYPVMVPYIFPN